MAGSLQLTGTDNELICCLGMNRMLIQPSRLGRCLVCDALKPFFDPQTEKTWQQRRHAVL